jgi:hypothetical protein
VGRPQGRGEPGEARVPFAFAKYAFADPQRVIAEDTRHSAKAQRYFCFGRVGEGILSVRFTYRTGSYESSAPGIGVKIRRSVSEKTRCTNEPIGNPKAVRDFLPSPAELAFRDEDVKITITLSKRSVEFFKSAAAKSDTQYQQMIRRLLDAYVEAHSGFLARRPSRTRAKGARAR